MYKLKDITQLTYIMSYGNINNTCIIYKLKITDSTILDDLNPFLADIFDSETHLQPIAQEYCMNRLDKWLSPQYERMIEYFKGIGQSQDDAVRNVNIQLATLIFQKYLDKWNRLANALFADYNPIENYNMSETGTRDKTTSVDTDMTTSSETESTDTSKYSGFNSGDSFNNVTESDHNGSVEQTTSGLSTKNKQIDDEDTTLTRSGNIGVTTSQQMIESEIELRRHQMNEIMYDDLDKILFLDIYE